MDENKDDEGLSPASSGTSNDTGDETKQINKNLNFVGNLDTSKQPNDAAIDVQLLLNEQDEIQDENQEPNLDKNQGQTNEQNQKENQEQNQDQIQDQKPDQNLRNAIVPFLIPPPTRDSDSDNEDDDDYKYTIQLPAEDVYTILGKKIKKYVRARIKIRIGAININCHLIVLQCYSEFFAACNRRELINLPDDEVSASAFIIAYNWMICKLSLLQRDNILELYKAAKFLRIKELASKCWISLSDEKYVREAKAYYLYVDACKCGGLECLKELLLRRICKYFLTLVSRSEFVRMDVNDLIILLNSNSVGVNTEIEVFMTAVYWLAHNWEDREQYVLDVMKTVRFTLIPLWFLKALMEKTGNIVIDRILVYKAVNELIREGITENNEEGIQAEADQDDLVRKMPRKWIFDKRCNYHHYLDCLKMERITYKLFLNNLRRIQTNAINYWRTFKYRKDVIHCCPIFTVDPQVMDKNLVDKVI